MGISGIMRLRNEEDYLGLVIESHLPFLDELIIIYNRCTDRTPEISWEYQKKFPEKIKVFKYEPYVYPQGSKEHKRLSYKSIHSMGNYSNYALSKTNFAYAIRVDGDHVAIPALFEKAVERVLKEQSKKYYYACRGINLWDREGNIYVNKNLPYMGGSDHGFFPVSKDIYFKHHEIYEVLTWKLRMIDLGPLFFHLKGMKRDRGISNYDLSENPDSFYHQLVATCYTDPELITFQDFFQNEKLNPEIPDPLDLGIMPVRN